MLNPECIKETRVVITRLVKGRLSDSTKRVIVPVPYGHENITLVLPCEDSLPYTLQVCFLNLPFLSTCLSIILDGAC